MAHGYLVALFDILGFEQKLATIGLTEMLARYETSERIKSNSFLRTEATLKPHIGIMKAMYQYLI
jgi:hypothetical protein